MSARGLSLFGINPIPLRRETGGVVPPPDNSITTGGPSVNATCFGKTTSRTARYIFLGWHFGNRQVSRPPGHLAGPSPPRLLGANGGRDDARRDGRGALGTAWVGVAPRFPRQRRDARPHHLDGGDRGMARGARPLDAVLRAARRG